MKIRFFNTLTLLTMIRLTTLVHMAITTKGENDYSHIHIVILEKCFMLWYVKGKQMA